MILPTGSPVLTPDLSPSLGLDLALELQYLLEISNGDLLLSVQSPLASSPAGQVSGLLEVVPALNSSTWAIGFSGPFDDGWWVEAENPVSDIQGSILTLMRFSLATSMIPGFLVQHCVTGESCLPCGESPATPHPWDLNVGMWSDSKDAWLGSCSLYRGTIQSINLPRD